MSITIPARVNTESIRSRYLVVILRRADVLDLPQPGQLERPLICSCVCSWYGVWIFFCGPMSTNEVLATLCRSTYSP